MMNFVVLTLSFTVAMLLASVIATVGLFALMGNGKIMAWLTKKYMKILEKSVKNFEDSFEDLGA